METICTLLVFLGLTLSVCSAESPCLAFWGAEPIIGVHTSADVCRYTVKYGQAGRWEDSVAVQTQQGINAAAFPPICPQVPSLSNVGATQNEDCLYAVVYAPVFRLRQPLPVFVWLHGGSYVDGSASAPGIEGTRLASQGNVVVITQYRQGVLGLLPPTVAPTAADPNLAVRDIVLLLNTVKTKILGFGGDSSQVTLAGQSTGATYVRTLWTTPSAAGLFHRMVLQSDALIYGSQSAATFATTQQMFKNQVCPNCTTLADFRALPVSSILRGQNAVRVDSFQTRPGTPLSGPFRPVYGTPTLPHESITALYNDPGLLSIKASEIPLLITSVKHEGDAAVYLLSRDAIAPTAVQNVYALYQFLLGSTRAAIMASAPDYAPTPATTDGRDVLAKAFTDGTFRCASRSLANKYAAAGGRVYVGEFLQGTPYVTTAPVPYCNGKVCHEDDLFPTFGTSGDQTFLGQINSLWSNFIKTGVPDVSWQPFEASTGVVGDKVRALGGDGVVPSCPANFWGTTLKWDWQVYTN